MDIANSDCTASKLEMDTELDGDMLLRRRVSNFLRQRNLPALRSVQVSVENGTVEIAGKVNSFYERQICLNCCQRVAGVVRIVDNVQVA